MPSDYFAPLRDQPALKIKLRTTIEECLQSSGFVPAVECSDKEKDEIGSEYLKRLRRRVDWFARLKRRFDLVSLQRIADWIARPHGDIMPDEERREQAYNDLRQAITDGEFGPRVKPGVLFFASASLGEPLPETTILAPGELPLRMTPKVAAIIALSGIHPLSEAWAPRDSVIRWYKARQHLLPPMPPWLAAIRDQQPAESQAGINLSADKRGHRTVLPRCPAAPTGAQQMPDEVDRRSVLWRRREWRRQ